MWLHMYMKDFFIYSVFSFIIVLLLFLYISVFFSFVEFIKTVSLSPYFTIYLSLCCYTSVIFYMQILFSIRLCI